MAAEGQAENRLADALAEDLMPAGTGGDDAAGPAEPGAAPAPETARDAALLGALDRLADPAAAPGAAMPAPTSGGQAAGAAASSAVPRGPALAPGATLAGAIEALLFVANEPLNTRELSDLLDRAPIPEVRAALRELRERYAREPRGFDLTEIAGGYRLLTRPEYATWVSRLETVRREERLSRAQLEALSVIAYRQPVLRADVDSMRGADSGGAIRGLVEKGLVKVVGRAEAVGRPLLYGTTERFLERFGLKSIRDLPKAGD
jgi:segregation and condensation protein B